MTFPGHNPHLFRWRSHGKNKTSADKRHLKNGDIDQWRKRVEMASEFAVSEVFSHKKSHSGTSSLAVPLQSSDQLGDHDDAYREAQALLGDWLNSKLRLELEMEEEDDLMCSTEGRGPAALASPQPTTLNYNNFDDLYNCLAEEEEHIAVNTFLQDLMEQEVLDSGMMEELALDVGQTRKKFRDPVVTMEARHQQVRENRARREAERQRQQRESKAQQDAKEEAKRREREEETRKKQEARRQEEMVQQEMVRLRRQMEERRGLEQLVRQRERERVEGQRSAKSLWSAPTLSTKQKQQDTERKLYKEQKIQTMVHMSNLKCLQRNFSGWFSIVLDRRLRMGKAMALCDWKRKLRAWRAWRTVVWAGQKQREVVRTEEELRTKNRQCQLAVESDRRRLLRRCLNEWHLWCRMEREQRELLAQQQETRRKMAALINAASTGKLKTAATPAYQPIMVPPEASNQPETTEREGHYRSGTLTLTPAREEEKQRQLKRQQELLKRAHQHYHQTLLLRRGLAPWKRLIQLRQANIQLAESHHNLVLLRRSLSCWKRLKDWRMIQEERAKRFYRTRALRRFLLALLDHVTQERLVEWDRQHLAQEHNNRRVLRQCFLAWRQLPCLLRKEREKEGRRERLGRKVTKVLPDFCSYPL
ncbi:coiled-coil domain-containing protein 191 isoform X1 [Lates japonicus]|uniref:Coiled-coil domain-containing protein 191 isoform X1 n=1 Tax=Lates japonicus TaxID=270547 RepID=A0AAD3MJ42_LATJO|nr:coiled-coil domain-containing protein 191 isoform X1 [Lates japonicus]